MIETAMFLFAVVVIACIFYWAINKVAAAFGLPPQIVVLIQVAVVVVASLLILGAFIGWVDVGHATLHRIP